MRSIRCLLPALVLYAASGALGNVYRCISGEEVIFTDVHCPGGELVAHAPTPRSAPTGLSAAELEALAALEQRLEREAGARRQRRSRARDRALSDVTARREACATAKRHLSAIRAQKRRGYPLAKAGSLDAKAARYEAMAADNC